MISPFSRPWKPNAGYTTSILDGRVGQKHGAQALDLWMVEWFERGCHAKKWDGEVKRNNKKTQMVCFLVPLLGGVLPPPGVPRQQALLRLAKRAAEGHPLSLEDKGSAALQKKLPGKLLGIHGAGSESVFCSVFFVGVDRVSFKKLKDNLNCLYLWDLWDLWDSMYTLRNMYWTDADSMTERHVWRASPQRKD